MDKAIWESQNTPAKVLSPNLLGIAESHRIER